MVEILVLKGFHIKKNFLCIPLPLENQRLKHTINTKIDREADHRGSIKDHLTKLIEKTN